MGSSCRPAHSSRPRVVCWPLRGWDALQAGCVPGGVPPERRLPGAAAGGRAPTRVGQPGGQAQRGRPAEDRRWCGTGRRGCRGSRRGPRCGVLRQLSQSGLWLDWQWEGTWGGGSLTSTLSGWVANSANAAFLGYLGGGGGHGLDERGFSPRVPQNSELPGGVPVESL